MSEQTFSLSSNRAPMLGPPCPICSTSVKDLWISFPGHPIWKCEECYFCFAVVDTPRGPAAPETLYEELYQKSDEYRALLAEAARTDRRARLAFAERFFFRHFPSPLGSQQLLDIGCGAGRFLRIASLHGWEVRGVEPAPSAAAVGQSLGLPIFQGDLTQFLCAFPNQRFDVVTAFEVIEHVPNPVPFLSQLREATLPGGYVLVSAPNVRDPYLRFDRRTETWPPVHVNFFSRKAIGRALERAGLQPIAVATNLLPLPTMRQVIRSRLSRAVLKPGLLILRLFGLIEGHQIAALAKRL